MLLKKIYFILVSFSLSKQFILTNINDFRIIENKAFELNLTSQKIERAKNNYLIFGAPYLGHYRSEAYNFNKRLGLVKFRSSDLNKILPDSLKKYIKKYFNLKSPNWVKELKEKINSINISSNIFGTLKDQKHKPKDSAYNIIYHAWVGSWPQYKNKNYMDFLLDVIDVGVFEPYNAQEISRLDLNKTKKDGDYIDSVAFNKVKTEPITWHFPEHLSPNNLLIKLLDNRNLSSFWILAISSDKKRLSIDQFIVFHNLKTENWFLNLLSKSKNIKELKFNINKEVKRTLWLSSFDKIILKNWIQL